MRKSSSSRTPKALEGIEVRHERSCPRSGERVTECARCTVSFRPAIYDALTRKHQRGGWTRVLADARAWRINRMQQKERGALLPANSVTLEQLAEEFIADLENGRAKSKFRKPYKPKTA